MIGNKFKKGFSLIEVILAVAIFGLFATALIGLLMSSYGGNFQSEERNVAVLYAEEGSEAVWSIRRQAWNLLANGDHGLDNSSGYWQFSGTSESLNDGKYTRVITIEDACRDGSGNLVECPAGTVDLYTKKITTTVTYTALTLVSNESLRSIIPDNFIFYNGDANSLAEALRGVVHLSSEESSRNSSALREEALKHDLSLLATKLLAAME